MRKVTLILGLALALVPAVALCNGIPTSNPFHDSVEDFYAGGGTVVTCISGCTRFSIGDTRGNPLWEVWEKVYYYPSTDPTHPNQTEFLYALTNDAVVPPIISFSVASNGVVPIDSETVAPVGWFSTEDSSWLYLYADPGYGLSPGSGWSNFQLYFPGYVPVTFGLASVDVGSSESEAVWLDCNISGNDCNTGNEPNWNWYASSPVPEPGSLTLFGTGLIGVAGLLRRKLKS